MLEAVRLQLAARAEALGWRRDCDADLRLEIDGVETRPLRIRDAAVFLLPASAQEVRLRSRSFRPSDDLGLSNDQRQLGLNLTSLSCGDDQEYRAIPLGDLRLRQGFYDEEVASGRGWRWTNGDAVLPRDLWSGLQGEAITLRIHYDAAAWNGWLAPEKDQREPIAAPRKLYAVA